jgi:hypothetical protein
MCNNLSYDPEPGDTEVPYDQLFKALPTLVPNDFFNMLNASFVVLQSVLPFCDYKVWIDTKRGLEVISYLCSMAWLNMMEEEFRGRRMTEC